MRKGFLFYARYSGSKRQLATIINITTILRDQYRLDVSLYHLEKNYDFLDVLFFTKPDFILIAGGDGTINFICNYMLNRQLDIPIGLIPSGTCNDLARCLNLPLRTEHLIPVLGAGKTTRIDVGRINHTGYFLTAYAGGLFAGVSHKTDTTLKKTIGPLAYYLKAFAEAVTFKPFLVNIQTDSGVFEGKAILFAVLNGRHIAGLSNIISTADMSDGNLDILIIKQCSRLDMANLFVKIFNRDLIHDKHVLLLQGKNLSITFPKHHPSLTADGEKNLAGNATIDVLSQRLEFLVP